MSVFSIVLGEYSSQGETLYKVLRAVLEFNYDHEDDEDLGELINEISFAYMCKDYLYMRSKIQLEDTFDTLLEYEKITSNRRELQEDILPIVADYDIDFGDGMWDLVQFNQFYFKEKMLKIFKDEVTALKVMDSLLYIDRFKDYPERNKVLSEDVYFGKYINHFE